MIDKFGMEVDCCEICFDDCDGKIVFLFKGVKLCILFGWVGKGLFMCGMYVVDEIELSGLFVIIVICGKLVDMCVIVKV